MIGSWPADPGLAERCNRDDLPRVTGCPCSPCSRRVRVRLDARGVPRRRRPDWFAGGLSAECLGRLRNHRWPNGSRSTATRPAGGLSSGPRSIAVPAARRAPRAASTSATVRCSVTGLPRAGRRRSTRRLGNSSAIIQPRTVDVELDVADPAVGHHDRLVRTTRAEHRRVPVDRGAGVGDGEVRRQLTHGLLGQPSTSCRRGIAASPLRTPTQRESDRAVSGVGVPSSR